MLGSWELRENDQGEQVLVYAGRDPDKPDEPAVELEVVGWESGRPVVETITVRKCKGATTRDIRVPLGRYMDDLATVFDFVKRTAPAPVRRELTDAFLHSVVDIYNAKVPGTEPVTAVQAQHGGSRASVYRWLKVARERGIEGA